MIPAENATGISPATNVYAFFSEPMRPTTITNSFKLQKVGSVTSVPATVTYDTTTRKATLDLSARLELGATYTATVTTAARDLAGNPLATTKTWRFTVRR